MQAFSSVLDGCQDVKLNPFALASLPPPANESALNSILLAALLDDTRVSVILRAIQQDLNTDILQAPALTVADGVRQVDPLIPIIATGPSLSMRPAVSADEKFVTLEFRPTVAVTLNTPDIQRHRTLIIRFRSTCRWSGSREYGRR